MPSENAHPPALQNACLIHGWAANRHAFDSFIPHLPESWRVRAVDLPGHGGAPFGGRFDIEETADALAARMENGSHVLGWSLGGLVALFIAARHPEKVRSLCLTATFARFTADEGYPEGLAQPALAKMSGAFKQDYAKYIKQFFQLQLLNTPNAQAVLDKILPDTVRHGVPCALDAALEAVNRADARPLLAGIETPVLLVFGDKDSITPPRMGDYLHRHLPHSELHIMAKAAHAPFLSHAEEFAALWTAFVENVA
ncbi:pimeloyl-ACP methyl ester esterase BioH [Neisseria sp.]|uniref:pimeloyl-ACP methyl ester esterase BioH n=1 Tax=Neisseria sp. TaxID=192066 RepID=UPI00359FB19B